MTNQPNPEVVARWCYKHGQWSHKCTGCELDKANELIAKLREELETFRALTGEPIIPTATITTAGTLPYDEELPDGPCIFPSNPNDLAEIANLKAERDQQAVEIERLEQDCKEWAEVNQEQARVLVIRTAEMNQQAARLREIREHARELGCLWDNPVIKPCMCNACQIRAIIDREKQNEKEENEI